MGDPLIDCECGSEKVARQMRQHKESSSIPGEVIGSVYCRCEDCGNVWIEGIKNGSDAPLK